MSFGTSEFHPKEHVTIGTGHTRVIKCSILNVFKPVHVCICVCKFVCICLSLWVGVGVLMDKNILSM